ncbi:hypothetical protein [Geothrix sp. PMB-07]|uniref:hypothetical protein n=1 Tax=Geothrix sp. PMB-07 TaxID=3068640 RepID=UPI0027407982|nr:hypothetical protein [Geothrix sp. PMB-07]WLT32037.1 hypothetical protein Q9293_01660 [Geothrix sp. PMB-07]
MTMFTRGIGAWAAAALLAAPLAAQEKKPVAAEMIWRYEAPRGFRLPEPAYRFPTQIKQALVDYVQPSPDLVRAYADVCGDKHRFAQWLQGLLLERKKGMASAADGGGATVLSSHPARMAPGRGAIVRSTARAPQGRTRVAQELEAIEDYLMVLKLWDPE